MRHHDVAKVIGTVAQAAFLFSEKYPERTLVIFPVDEKRRRLYNLVFRRRLSDIQTYFEIFGKRKLRWEAFDPEMEYDAFEILRKQG